MSLAADHEHGIVSLEVVREMSSHIIEEEDVRGPDLTGRKL